MQIWQAIVLGAVQGFTEFLPVSSSGHLLVLQRVLGITNNQMLYSIALHLGSLLPVVWVLKKEIFSLFKSPFNKLKLLIVATVPAGVVGLAFALLCDLDATFTQNPWLIAFAFTLTAVELGMVERTNRLRTVGKALNGKIALTMGIGQALAVIPGLSRSGTVIAFGSKAGLEREENARFTFLMSVPIILSAVVMECFGCIKSGGIGNISIVPLAFGVTSSAVTGYVAITGMLKLISKGSYKFLIAYLVLLAVTIMVFGV